MNDNKPDSPPRLTASLALSRPTRPARSIARPKERARKRTVYALALGREDEKRMRGIDGKFPHIMRQSSRAGGAECVRKRFNRVPRQACPAPVVSANSGRDMRSLFVFKHGIFPSTLLLEWNAPKMKSLRNVAFAVAFGVFMLGATIYLAQFGQGAAILFNMVSYGIISAVIARTKNRNSFGWFFIGFFLSLVGVALALAKAPNPAVTEKAV